MVATLTPPPRTRVMNLPNQLTLGRLGLAVLVFVTIPRGWYGLSLVLFVLAAATDWLDGYLARRFDMITNLGRILDPFADKVIVCGTLTYLVAVPASGLHELGLQAWLVVLVVGRELLITALRSFLEQQGADFSAAVSGKLKMVAQSALIALSLGFLAWPGWFPASNTVPGWYATLVQISVWATAIMTAWSGAAYVRSALRLMRELDK